MQVDPTVAVGLGATVVVEDGFTVVDVAEVAFVLVAAAVVDGLTEVEIGATGSFQTFNFQDAPQSCFASPAQGMEQSASEVLELAAGAASEHQHSRP